MTSNALRLSSRLVPHALELDGIRGVCSFEHPLNHSIRRMCVRQEMLARYIIVSGRISTLRGRV
jgi:hypothetical protein